MTTNGTAPVRTISQAEMLETFLYDAETGELFWKASRSRNAKAGGVAGSLHSSGYRQVRVNNIAYREHRVIWVMHFGPIPVGLVINHKDENPSNNRLENLETVTPSQNTNRGTRNARIAAAQSKPVYCHQTLTTYSSIKLAAKKLKLSAGNISKVLNNRRKHTGGFSFSYLDTSIATNISEKVTL